MILTVLAQTRARWAPPPNLTVSEFADKEIVVASGPLAGTRWRTDFAPYQRGILDAIHEPGCQFVVVMGSSQWGKTAVAVNIVAYHIAHAPCPILVVQPTVDPMAKDFVKNRLDPTIKASPSLERVVDKRRQKDASNTTLLKTFKGGFLAMAGSNSAASLAARSIQLLVMDEPDRYERTLKGEGDTISIAIKRTTTYRSRRRVVMTSSPTLTHAPIHAWFLRGDQRRYYVPCPLCAHMHPYEWQNVRWENGDPGSARLVCPACGYRIDEAERVGQLGAGEWRAEATPVDASIRSFHIWEAYSPLSSLADIVRGFMRARESQKTGDPAEMHTWQNTTLGEPIEPDAGAGVEPHALIARREAYGDDIDAPVGVAVITLGIDVQDDRIEFLAVGWGIGEESWIVDRQTLPGDTSQPEPWQALEEALSHEYRHGSGVRLPILASAIDSGGHRTTMVYDFAARLAARRVFAVIGRDGQRPIVSSPSPKQWGKVRRKVPLYTVGVDAAKALWISRMVVTERGSGYVHVPVAEWADEELAAQLTSERLVTKFERGVPRQKWVKLRPRNEALDSAVYALAALRLTHPDLEAAASRLGRTPAARPSAPSDAHPGRARWITKRPSGWLRGR